MPLDCRDRNRQRGGNLAIRKPTSDTEGDFSLARDSGRHRKARSRSLPFPTSTPARATASVTALTRRNPPGKPVDSRSSIGREVQAGPRNEAHQRAREQDLVALPPIRRCARPTRSLRHQGACPNTQSGRCATQFALVMPWPHRIPATSRAKRIAREGPVKCSNETLPERHANKAAISRPARRGSLTAPAAASTSTGPRPVAASPLPHRRFRPLRLSRARA